jgi:hypothetical protein
MKRTHSGDSDTQGGKADEQIGSDQSVSLSVRELVLPVESTHGDVHIKVCFNIVLGGLDSTLNL